MDRTLRRVESGDMVLVQGDPQPERVWRVFSLHRGTAFLELAAGESMAKFRRAEESDLIHWGRKE